MKLNENLLGTYELENDGMEIDEGSFVMMDLTDLLDAYNIIQGKLKEEGILSK